MDPLIDRAKNCRCGDWVGLLVLALATMPAALPAPSARADEELSLNGFVQSHVTARTDRDACRVGTKCNFPAAELRGQIKAEAHHPSGAAAFVARVDLVGDLALESTRLDPREVYGDLISEKLAVRAGRQVITWGVGDLLFINDTFPKDWTAFYLGQPQEYLKLGSDAVKINAYPGAVNLELVAAGFRADRLAEGRRFVFVDPLGNGTPRRFVEPGYGIDDIEFSGKLSGYLENWELAGYASRGHWRGPSRCVSGAEVVCAYSPLNTFGASLTGPLGGGVINLESGYYDSSDDRGGGDPSVPNSQFRGLVGYSHQLWEDATLSGQLYGEWMNGYDAYRATLPAGSSPKDRLRQVATLRFTQMFAHQTAAFNLFAFWGYSEKDVQVIPSLRYAFTDYLWGEVGVNIIAGNRNGMIGSMRDNDIVYATIRYAF